MIVEQELDYHGGTVYFLEKINRYDRLTTPDHQRQNESDGLKNRRDPLRRLLIAPVSGDGGRS